MKKIYKLILIAFLFVTFSAKAQNDGITMTLLPHLSYNNYYNPAMPIDSKVVFGVGVSNIGLSVFNSSIRYDNLFTNKGTDALTLDANKFINSLDEHDNFINTNFSIDIIRLGFKVKRFFFDFDCKFRYNGEFHYSKDFLGFFVNGNGNYLGNNNPADFSIGVDINTFTEMSLGIQYAITDKLTVGIRPKLLVGIANLSVNDDQTMIYTDPNTYEMTADVNINIKASTLLNMDINRISDIGTYIDSIDNIAIEDMFVIDENIGYGIDFGLSYTFNKHFGIAAGVYDLGYITWRNSKEKHNHKDRVVVNDALINDFDELINMNLNFEDLYTDLIEDVWDDDSLYVGADYQTALKTRIMLQAYWELNPLIRFTAISQMYYVKDQFRPAMTLAYSGSFFRFLNFTASYTASKYAGNSVGFGFGVNLGPLNVYAITDNIMILSKLNTSPLEMATSYSSANFRLGLVFTLGKIRN